MLFDECKWEIFREKKNASKPNLADGECSMMQKLPGKLQNENIPYHFSAPQLGKNFATSVAEGYSP